MPEKYDVIVIGAGVGGLTVAGLCALEGLKGAIKNLDSFENYI